MEYLDGTFVNWKSQLIDGIFEPQTAHKTALMLAQIHSCSWDNQEAKRIFSTSPNFWSLRIEPYLITAGERNPEL